MILPNQLQKIENYVIFQTENGKVNLDAYFQDETLWLSQKRIAELFEKDRTVISKHLKNIFESGELQENLVRAKFAHTTQHGAIKDKISMLEAKIKAKTEYDIFRIEQDKNYLSDFDKMTKSLKNKTNG